MGSKVCLVSVHYHCNINSIIGSLCFSKTTYEDPRVIGRASLARENEAGDNWGQEVHILHVNV